MSRPTTVPMGKHVIRTSEGPFRVMRHGGRGSDTWREAWSGASCETARTQYINTVGCMRQGGVRLQRADGSTIDEVWAPRLRTRW